MGIGHPCPVEGCRKPGIRGNAGIGIDFQYKGPALIVNPKIHPGISSQTKTLPAPKRKGFKG
jgi:hypothetical protein